jgi:hypothetical protein
MAAIRNGAFAPEVLGRSASRPYLGIFDSRRFALFEVEPLSLGGGWNFVRGGQQGTVSGRPLSRGLIFRRNGARGKSDREGYPNPSWMRKSLGVVTKTP